MSVENLLKTKIDIVEYIGRFTELRPKGSLYEGRCPIHGSDEGTPLVIYPQTNSYYCFACESGGDIIQFVSDYDDISRTMAIKKLAHEANINIDADEDWRKAVKVEDTHRAIIDKAKGQLDKVIDYLHKRGFTDETIASFELGFNNDTLVIPIRNEYGQPVAIARRQFDKSPKYINSRNNIMYDKSALLYNLDQAIKIKNKDELYMVEGYMDAISGHQMGLATVAYCGNEVHKDQLRTLTRALRKIPTIIYCPDNDAEGIKRVPRVRDYFREILPRIAVRVLQLPEGIKDFNDALKAGIDVSTLPKIHIDKYVLWLMLDNCKSEEDEYDVAHDFLKTVSNPLFKADIIKKLCERWNREFAELKDFFDSYQEDTDELVQEASTTTEAISDLKNLYMRGEYKTHFQNLDKCIGGMVKSQVMIVGAYSSAGKTDWLIEYLLRQVIKNKARTVFFSLEMSKGKVMERIIAKILRIRLADVRELVMNGDERIAQVESKLSERLVIYDNNNLNIDEIEHRIVALNRKNTLGGPVDIVAVDYFTYLKGASTYEGASEQALKMKGLAKKYNVILVMLSQLNRGANTYNEPTMDLLRMTGDIEASGDVIIMLWRPEKEPGLSLQKQEELKNITRMKVEKARDGIYGPIRMELKYNNSTSLLEEQFD